MRISFEPDNPLLDTPNMLTIWTYEWNDEDKEYDVNAWDMEIGELPWKIQD